MVDGWGQVNITLSRLDFYNKTKFMNKDNIMNWTEYLDNTLY